MQHWMSHGLWLVTHTKAWYDEHIHTVTMQHACERFPAGMYFLKILELESLMTHYTKGSVRVQHFLGIDDTHILQGIADCCKLADVLSAMHLLPLRGSHGSRLGVATTIMM